MKFTVLIRKQPAGDYIAITPELCECSGYASSINKHDYLYF